MIVCCYNSAERLPDTLRHLSAQRVAGDLEWEVVLVNNNSTDNTVAIARETWDQLASSVPFRVVHENNPGLSNARKRGMQQAQFDTYLFCDDDNWLSTTYVQTVYEILTERSDVAAVGGWCEAVFEISKPDWFDRFAGNFAVGRSAESSGYLDEASQFLYGAGMAIRRQSMDHLHERGFKQVLSDRKGDKLSSGGDVELCYALKLAGCRLYFDERLYFKHYMPKDRLSIDYLKRLRTSMTYADYVLGIYLKFIRKKNGSELNIFKKYLKYLRQIKTLRLVQENAGKYESLELQSQIDIRRTFIKNPFGYCLLKRRIGNYVRK